MHSRCIDGIVIRPLRDGDTATVQAVFDRLSPDSRRCRFGGAKTALTPGEAALLARVDGLHHVLVAYVAGDARPAGIARLVREGDAAEVAFEVADEHQGRGIGTALATTLTGDARAAGITELHATVTCDVARATSLLRRSSRRVRASWLRGERHVVAALE